MSLDYGVPLQTRTGCLYYVICLYVILKDTPVALTCKNKKDTCTPPLDLTNGGVLTLFGDRLLCWDFMVAPTGTALAAPGADGSLGALVTSQLRYRYRDLRMRCF